MEVVIFPLATYLLGFLQLCRKGMFIVVILNLQIPKRSAQEKAKVTILMSDQVNFKTKNITRDKEDFFVMIKVLVQRTSEF